MFVFFLAITFFASLEIGWTAEIPEVFGLLNSNLQFTIRLQDNGSKTLSSSKFIPFGVRNRPYPPVSCPSHSTSEIDLYRVEELSTNKTWTIILTDAGDEVRLYNRSREEVVIHLSREYFAFNAEVKKVANLDDIIAALIRAFSRLLPYDNVLIANHFDPVDRSVSWISGITKSGLLIDSIEIAHIDLYRWDDVSDIPSTAFESSNVTEDALLRLIHSTNATQLFTQQAQPWNLTNSFYQDPFIKKASMLLLHGVEHSGITDESLLGLSATKIILGRAPAITLAGLRAFFKRVLEEDFKEDFKEAYKEYVLEFTPAFIEHTPEKIFEDYAMTTKGQYNNGWWFIQAPARNASIIYMNTTTFNALPTSPPGVYSFDLIVRKTFA